MSDETSPTPKPRVLTLREASGFLRVHPNTIMKLAKLGVIPGRKIGMRWRFLESELEAYLRGDQWE